MALYLGGEKVKIHLGAAPCRLEVIFVPDSIFLLSSDGFVLTDCNGVYLMAKERENYGG